MRKLIVFTLFLLIFVFSCKKPANVYDHIKESQKITDKDYKTQPLENLYYYLVYNIVFTENYSKVKEKIDYFEYTALATSDSTNIFRANNLKICLNPKISSNSKRYKLIFNAANYFETNNNLYDAYLTNYLIAEYYFYLQYFQLAENYAYKAIENLGSKNNEYAFEKASTLILISNIHYHQKKYQEAFNTLKSYEEVSGNFNKKLVKKEKINLLESTYINNYAILEKKIGKVHLNKTIENLTAALKLNSNNNDNKSKVQKINTLHNLITHKIEADNLDSLDFYLKELESEKEFIFSIPVLQLNYAVIGDYLLKIKKDTIEAKKFQKNILVENQKNYQNIFLEKRILEQIIQKTDSSSTALNQHYLKVVSEIKNYNDKKLNINQKVVYENHQLIRKNTQLKREIYFVVAIILTVSIVVLLVIFNIIQKINLKKIQLRNQYIEQDTQALEVTLNYKNDIEKKLNENKKQIFMELHDNIVNKLFSTRFLLHIDYIKPESFTVAKTTILDVKQNLERICDNYSEMNNLFEKDSFHKMLIELIKNQPNNLIDFDYDFDQSIEWFKTHPKVRFHLYRVVQELLQNIHKHSLANHAKINIYKENNLVKLVVLDNGKGFTKNTKKGLGINNIINRLKLINATFDIETENGTKFTITIKL